MKILPKAYFCLVLVSFLLESKAETWAVLVDSSKFYFNYRHTVNTLMFYSLLKRYNVDDEHIILMLPENHQCHPRNIYPGKIEDGFHGEDLMADVEVDYRGAEVSPESIVQVLTGRHIEGTPHNKRLRSSENSKLFVYLTGHGGNGYFKIQDTQVLLSTDLANAVYEMYYKGKFEEIMIFIDSCQALPIFDHIDLPGFHGLSSSLNGQPAKSYGTHRDLGVTATDHFSYFFVELFRGKNLTSVKKMDLDSIIKKLPSSLIKSQIGLKSRVKPANIMITDFISDKLQMGLAKSESKFEHRIGKEWISFKEAEEPFDENVGFEQFGFWFSFVFGFIGFALGLKGGK